jgi:hypothetical protein
MLPYMRVDLSSDETASLYFDARAKQQAGIVRAELTAPEQEIYDKQRDDYIELCRSFRSERLEERTWTPLAFPTAPMYQSAPRRLARPRAHRGSRRRVATGRRTVRRVGTSGSGDSEPADLDPPGAGRASRRGPEFDRADGEIA